MICPKQQLIEQVLDRRESGEPVRSIARNLGVSRGFVFYHCMRTGTVAANDRAPVPPKQTRLHCGPNGRLMRRFSAAEDEQLKALLLRGLTYSAIASILGRQKSSIRMRAIWLAAQQEMLPPDDA